MTDRKIVENICMGKMTDADTRKFLQAALENTRKKSLADVFPAACYVVLNTNNYRLFQIAEEVINQIWVHLSQFNSYWRFERVVYNLFWPRVKSIRNIKIHAAEPDGDDIFWDSLSWIRSIQFTRLYNPELYRYFESISKLDNGVMKEIPRELKGRALDIKNKKATPEEQFNNTLQSSAVQDAMVEFAYSTNSVNEARVLMDAIIKKDGRIEMDDGVICINRLLRVNRSKRVRTYILRRIRSEYFFFAIGDVADFFMSAAVGIMSDSEFQVLKEMVPSLAKQYPNIDTTLKLARDNLAAEKFQKKTIRESEIVKKTIKQYSYKYRPVYDIDRFRKMDKRYYETAVAELSAGQKQGHYMWYLFPQIKGLGQSKNSEYYGVEDLIEAKEYFADPVLREHLLNLCNIILKSDVKNIKKILPEPDNLKLHSCATLFRIVSPHHTVFDKILKKYYKGEPDRATLYLLSKNN